MNPFKVVEMFEEAIAEYCGSKYAVAVDSCTNALTLCLRYYNEEKFGDEWGITESITIPRKTYVSVPQSILNAQLFATPNITFEDSDEWQKIGYYQLKPYPIYDSARLCTSDMYIPNSYMCLSLHWGKTLNLGQGGVILTDDDKAVEWLKKARWDGRTAGLAPVDDEIKIIGMHCPMSPRDAADALTRLHFLPKHNKPLPVEKGYADLSKFKVFNEL